MKKLFVLMLVVLAVMAFVTPASHSAEAGHSCLAGYNSSHGSHVFTIYGQEPEVGATVTLDFDLCYNGITLYENIRKWADISHPRWTLHSIQVSNPVRCEAPDNRDCREYQMVAKFNRTHVDGSWRQPVCANYGFRLEANGYYAIYTIYAKYLC